MLDLSIGSGTWATMFASSFTVVLVTGWFVSRRVSLDLMPDGTIIVRNLFRRHVFDRHEVDRVTGSQYPYSYMPWRTTGSVPLVAVHLRDGRRVKIMATASDNAETLSRSLALLRSAGLRDLPSIAVLRYGGHRL